MRRVTKRRVIRAAEPPIEALAKGTRSILRESRAAIAPGGDPATLRRARPKYVLGASTPEKERLLKQCEPFEPEARWMLAQIGVQRNWWTVDVGCGPLGILDLLTEYTGPGAEVIGLERDLGFLEFGRELMAGRGLSAVRLIQGDARNTGLPPSSFDLAHARLLLVNVPDPQEVVSEMVTIVRPGGWVALEEVDWISWVCDPMHPALARLLEINAAIWRARGMDVNIGRRLPRMLQQAGMTDIQCKTHTSVFRHSDEYQYLLLAFSKINRDEMINGGYTTEAEWTEMTESLRQHLADPGTYVTWSLFCQAWGRKAAYANGFSVSARPGAHNTLASSSEGTFSCGSFSIVGSAQAHQKSDWNTAYRSPFAAPGSPSIQDVQILSRSHGGFIGATYKGLSVTSSYTDWQNASFVRGDVGAPQWTRGFADVGYEFKPASRWTSTVNVTYTTREAPRSRARSSKASTI